MHLGEYHNIAALEVSHFWYKANREFSLKLIDRYCRLPEQGKVLDAGCGAGGTTTVFKKYGRVTGIDIHPLALKLAKNYPIDHLIKASVNKLPFSKNSFDLITSFDVLYHQKVDPPKALTEMFRVLKNGGWILVRVPAFEFLRGSHDTVVQTGRRFTASQLANLIENSGLKICRLTYFNSVLFLPCLLWRNINSESGSDIAKLWPPLNFLLYIVLKIESKLALKINMPVGTSVYCLAFKPGGFRYN